MIQSAAKLSRISRTRLCFPSDSPPIHVLSRVFLFRYGVVCGQSKRDMAAVLFVESLTGRFMTPGERT